MNSLERFNASIRGDPIDRTSVAPILTHHAAIQAKEPMTRVAFNPKLMASVLLQSLRKHGYDNCTPIGSGMADSMGSEVLIRDWEQIKVVDFAIKSSTDIVKLKIPNPLKDGRMPVLFAVHSKYSWI